MVPTGRKGYADLRDASNHIYSIKKIEKKSSIFLPTSLKLFCQIISRVAYAVTFTQFIVFFERFLKLILKEIVFSCNKRV